MGTGYLFIQEKSDLPIKLLSNRAPEPLKKEADRLEGECPQEPPWSGRFAEKTRGDARPRVTKSGECGYPPQSKLQWERIVLGKS